MGGMEEMEEIAAAASWCRDRALKSGEIAPTFNARVRRKRRLGLVLENMEGINQGKAFANARKGILWSQLREVVPGSGGDLKKAWKRFFNLRVFNWHPEAVLGGDWKPSCVTCGQSDKVKENTKCHPARLVYDRHDNYLLNAPVRYACSRCSKDAKRQKACGISRKDRT